MQGIVRTPIFKVGSTVVVQCLNAEVTGRVTAIQHDGSSEPLYTLSTHAQPVTALEHRLGETAWG